MKARGFRSLEFFDGELYATMSDYRGTGVVVASPRPWEGNDSWRQVTPPVEEFPVWAIKVFNGFLYAGTGLLSILLGADYLDYGVLSRIFGVDAITARSHGILMVEIGVGITVMAVMVHLYYSLASAGRYDEGL